MADITAALVDSFKKEEDPLYGSFVNKKSDGRSMGYDYYLNDKGEKVKHGTYFRKHKDGSLSAEGKYENGVKVGVWKEYRPDGTLESSYEFGESVNGRQKRINKSLYDEQGKYIDFDKQAKESDWKNRKNTFQFQDAVGGNHFIDFPAIRDGKLIEDRQGWIEARDRGSQATAGYFNKIIKEYDKEIQIRKDAGRWKLDE